MSANAPSSNNAYDRTFKRLCFEEVLEHYNSFISIANYPEDVRLVFFLTMCRMLDKARGYSAESSENRDESEPWNLPALFANQQRLFSRYKFDQRIDETANADEFVSQLLDPPHDTTTKFV